MKTNHCRDEIQEFLDGRLSDDRRKEVEEHLKVCVECRKEMEALGLVKRAVSSGVSYQTPPETLKNAILQKLDEQEQPEERRQPLAYGWRIALSFVILVVAVVGIRFLVQGGKTQQLPLIVASDFQAVQSGRLTLQLESRQPAEMEQYYRDQGIHFETRVFDLQMMEYHLIGGRVNSIGNNASALFVYEGPGGKKLVCQMYEGSVADLPESIETRENNGIQFYIYRIGEVTAVFWQEGNVTCVLASDIDAEELISLAYAKAVPL